MPLSSVPFFNRTSSRSESIDVVSKSVLVYNQNSKTNISFPPLVYDLPDAFVEFIQIDTSSKRLEYSYTVNDYRIEFYHRENNFTRTKGDNLIVLEGKLAFM